jgi:sterol desaturase/sphingolipid hydroxylase (fatty acid hydroxylase superfamily)
MFYGGVILLGTVMLVLEKRISDLIVYPFQLFFLGSSQIYWLYLLGAVLIAIVMYVCVKKWQENVSFWQYILPKEVYTHPSSVTQYKYFFAIALFEIVFVEPIAIYLDNIADMTNKALTEITNITAPWAISNAQIWHNLMFTLFIGLLADFANFFYHYLSHKNQTLWEFHKVHHSAEVITPLTVYRTHPVELLVGVIIITTATGLGTGIWSYLFGTEIKRLLVCGVSLDLFIFYLAGYNLRHSHVWLAYPRWVSHIFISPAQHQIHHSADPKHYDKNFGYILGIWDWIFGCLYIPSSYEKLNFGLANGESNLFNSVSNIFLQPFRSVWQQMNKTRV